MPPREKTEMGRAPHAWVLRKVLPSCKGQVQSKGSASDSEFSGDSWPKTSVLGEKRVLTSFPILKSSS